VPSAKKISLENAKQDKLFYFVANVIIYRDNDCRCLLLKRSTEEKVHPGKYAVPGGKLEWTNLDLNHPTRMNGDVIDFENVVKNLLKREVFEEAGIEIYPELNYINSVAFIRPDGIPVVLVKYAARYKSGEVKLEEGPFTDFVWVNGSEVKSYQSIDGIAGEIARTIKLYQSFQGSSQRP
jgi:ADP-ribose pyrophosphatase YjhB (NUDIX family)